MSDLLPFVVAGLVAGSLYGLAGTGLVLTYRTAGVFNLAHGAIGAAAAYAFYELHFTHGLPWPLAMVIAMAAVGVGIGVLFERLGRRLAAARPATAIVGTVGALLLLQGFLAWQFGAETKNVPEFLPTSGYAIFGVQITWGQTVVLLAAAAATAGLYAMLRFTGIGIAMRGVVDDPSLLALTGITPARVRTVAWVIGASFASLTGILIAPSLGLDAVLLTLLVVQAFGACAVGRFSSLPLTYAGGLLVGVLASLATKYFTQPSLSGVPSSLPFLVLFVVMLITPRRKLAVQGPVARRLPNPVRIDRRLTTLALAGAATCLIAVPTLVGARLPVWTNGLTMVIVFVSLSLLVQLSGQVSLCHAAFVAFGATTFAHLTTGAGIPWLPALLLAGLCTAPLGLVVAVPAIRLSGIYVAIATFGLAIIMERAVYRTGLMFGEAGFRSASRPDLLITTATSDRAYYFVVLAVVAAAVAVTLTIRRSQLGRFLAALAESPASLTTAGLDLNVTRALLFGASAVLAGIAGALLIGATGQVSGVGFGPFQSLTWLAVMAIAGTRPVLSPMVASLALVIAPAYLPSGFVEYQTMLFGALAIVAAVVADGGLRLDLAAARERTALTPVRERHAVQAVTT
jgi:branched-subunit amino acid ABC-type transport system permease component